MLRRLLRWLLYSLGMLGLLAVLAMGALWWFFPAEQARKYVLDILETRLQRPVHLKTLQVRGLGVVLTELRVPDSVPDAPPLLQVEAVRIRLSVRHILTRRLVVERIIIDRPQLSLIERQGRWNVQELLDALAADHTVAAPPAPPEPPGEPERLALPVALELDRLLIYDLRLHVQRDNGLDIRLQGLSVQLSGALSQEANALTAHVYTASDTATLHVAGFAAQPAHARLDLDLRLAQQNLRTASLAGTLRVTAPELQLGTYAGPLALAVDTDLQLDLPAQTLAVRQIQVRVGTDVQVMLQGHITQVQDNPTLDLDLTGGYMALQPFQGLLASSFPDATLQGNVTIPHLTIRGPALPSPTIPLRLMGQAAFDGLALQVPTLDLTVQGLQGTFTHLEGSLLAYQPQDVRGVLEVHLAQAMLAGVTLEEAQNTITFALDATQPGHDTLEAALHVQRLRYRHPQWGEVATSLRNTLKVVGNFPRGDFTTLALTSQSSLGMQATLHGSIERFGSAGIDVTQQTTIQLDTLLAALPAPLVQQWGDFEATGTLQAQHHLRGSLSSAPQAMLTLQSQLTLNHPILRYGTLATLQDVAGAINLNATYVLPDYLRTLDLAGNVTLRAASVLPQAALGDSTIQLHLRVPERSSPQADLHPVLDVELRSAVVHQPQFATTLQDLVSTLRLQGVISAHSVTNPQDIALPDLFRKPQLQGALRWSQLHRQEQFETGKGMLRFKAQAPASFQQRSQTEVQMQVANVRSQHGDKRSPATTFSLDMQTSQHVSRGDLTVHHLQLTAPSLLRLSGAGHITGWGQAFRLNLDMPECHLGPVLARLPAPYRALLPSRITQGQVALTLATEGPLPTLESIREQRFPPVDLRLRLHDISLAMPDQNLDAQGLSGALHVRHQDNVATLRGEMTVARFSSPALPGNRPLAIRATFDHTLEAWRRLRIRTQQVELPDYGLTMTVQGTLDGLATLLEQQEPLAPQTLFNTLAAQLTLTQTLDQPRALSQLMGGVPLQGSVHNTMELTLHPGKTVHISGDLKMTNIAAEYAPLLQLSGLEGTMRYHKTLTLNQTPRPAPRVQRRSATASQRHATAPSALRNQLRAYTAHRDSLVIERLLLGPLSLSALAVDIAFQEQTFALDHFQANLLDGALAGTLRIGQLDAPAPATGLRLTCEFAQANLARLLPAQTGLAPQEGSINGNLAFQLAFPASPSIPLDLNALSVTLNITHIGTKALDRLLLFFDPLGQKPTIANQRRLLKFATPRLFTLLLRNGVLHLNTDLDTPIGRKSQPVSPFPIGALARSGFPQVSVVLQQLERLRALIQPLTAQGIRVEKDGAIVFY